MLGGVVASLVWPFLKGLSKDYRRSNPGFLWISTYTTAALGWPQVVALVWVSIFHTEDIVRVLYNRVVKRIVTLCDIAATFCEVFWWFVGLICCARFFGSCIYQSSNEQ